MAKQAKSTKVLFIILAIVGVLLIVPCIGVIAAVVIPSFAAYSQRSKSAEARSTLESLYRLSAAYYEAEHHGPGGELLTHCTVGAGRTENTPSAERTLVDVQPGTPFEALGHTFFDPIYYQYEIVSAGGCGHGPSESLYTFRAHGDLDGDGDRSRFELTAESSPTNELVRSGGIEVDSELE